jgi:hypothetical protein
VSHNSVISWAQFRAGQIMQRNQSPQRQWVRSRINSLVIRTDVVALHGYDFPRNSMISAELQLPMSG